jgi:hypothetical protein
VRRRWAGDDACHATHTVIELSAARSYIIIIIHSYVCGVTVMAVLYSFGREDVGGVSSARRRCPRV